MSVYKLPQTKEGYPICAKSTWGNRPVISKTLAMKLGLEAVQKIDLDAEELCK